MFATDVHEAAIFRVNRFRSSRFTLAASVKDIHCVCSQFICQPPSRKGNGTCDDDKAFPNCERTGSSICELFSFALKTRDNEDIKHFQHFSFLCGIFRVFPAVHCELSCLSHNISPRLIGEQLCRFVN